MSLDDFDDDHDRCNERILESIQQNWIEGGERLKWKIHYQLLSLMRYQKCSW